VEQTLRRTRPKIENNPYDFSSRTSQEIGLRESGTSIKLKKTCCIGREANELVESEVSGVEKTSYTEYRKRKAPL